MSVKTNAAQKVTYGELIGGKKFNLALDSTAKRKPASEWTILGKPIPRLDIPAMATGQFEYVHNVRVPGMLHGQVVRPPAIGASVMSVDESSVKNLPGVMKVVVKKNFVGVVAEKPWQAIQAAAKLKVEWTKGTGLPNQAGFHEFMRNQKQTRDTLQVNAKDVDEKLSAASKVVKATSLSVSNARIVRQFLRSRRCSAREARPSGRQLRRVPTRSSAAMVLGLRAQDVHVIFKMGSGCYGCNSADTVSMTRPSLSQAVGKPVRVQLLAQGRDDFENYGYAFCWTRRPLARWNHSRVGSRSMVAGVWQSPGNQSAGKRHHGIARRIRAGSVRRSPPPRSPQISRITAMRLHRTPRRNRNRFQCASSDSQHSLAVFHRAIAVSRTAAEHVRARVVHGRDAAAVAADPVAHRPEASGGSLS